MTTRHRHRPARPVERRGRHAPRRSSGPTSTAPSGSKPAQRLRPPRPRGGPGPGPRRSTPKRKAGEPLGPLAGVPVAIKDVLCVEGEPTTCGSRMLRNFRPPYDATVIARLKAAGADPLRQDEHGRVRDGLVHREQRLRPDPQPLGRGAHPRRLLGRLGRGGRRRPGAARRSAPTPAARSASPPPSAGSSA